MRDSTHLNGTEKIRDTLILWLQASSAVVPTWMSGCPFPFSGLRDQIDGQKPVDSSGLCLGATNGHLLRKEFSDTRLSGRAGLPLQESSGSRLHVDFISCFLR